MRRLLFLAALSFPALLDSQARAQWTYSVLNPPGQSAAGIYANGPGMLAGFVGPFATARATIWNSYDPASAIDVTPAGATQSQITHTTGTQHVGNTVIGGVRVASLWQGTVFTSLHPGGYALSYANGTDGVHQVGFARATDGNDHAFMWSGTAASAVHMDPPGTRASRIYSIAAGGGGRAVGSVEYPPPDLGNRKAGYWSGTAASFTLLPVPASTISSEASTIAPDGQSMAGQVTLSTDPFNTACMWQNGGFVPLNPPGYSSSSVIAMDAGFEVGECNAGSGPRAALWQGSIASFVNLSSILPAAYTTADAFGVYSTETDVWVGGYAFNTGTNGYNAILWHDTIPAPGAAGTIVLGAVLVVRRRRSPSGGRVHPRPQH